MITKVFHIAPIEIHEMKRKFFYFGFFIRRGFFLRIITKQLDISSSYNLMSPPKLSKYIGCWLSMKPEQTTTHTKYFFY